MKTSKFDWVCADNAPVPFCAVVNCHGEVEIYLPVECVGLAIALASWMNGGEVT